MPTISQRAVDKIVGYEVSSRAYYEKNYQRPEWPGGASGVTIGIGYDLGYASPAKIEADWGRLVSPEMLGVMKKCSGVTGSRAQALCRNVRSQIIVPWNPAMKVFLERDVPQWTDRVCKAVPLADTLPPDCLGALVSLAYNRGASFNSPGDRYKEMRDIRDHTASKRWNLNPGDLRAMKRLWPNVKGLRDRREDEAKLFEAGLKAGASQPLPDTREYLDAITYVANDKPPVLAPKPAGTQEVSTGGAGTAATAAAAAAAAQSGWQTWQIVAIAVGVAVVAALAVWLVRKVNGAPVVARQKDMPNVVG